VIEGEERKKAVMGRPSLLSLLSRPGAHHLAPRKYKTFYQSQSGAVSVCLSLTGGGYLCSCVCMCEGCDGLNEFE